MLLLLMMMDVEVIHLLELKDLLYVKHYQNEEELDVLKYIYID
jgi:hypothetical protein